VYSALHRGSSYELPAPSNYRQFTRLQSNALSVGKWNDQRNYWLNYLKDANLALSAPFDFPTKSSDARGETLRFRLGQELTLKTKALAASLNVSLYAFLLAGYKVLLLRVTAQEDLLVGSVVSGRNSVDWTDTVGYFVNQVVFRARWNARKSFKDFVTETQMDLAKALGNQDYPFSMLSEDFHLHYGSRGEPLTRIMFNLQSTMKMPTQGLSSFALNHAGSRFDLGELALEAIEIENRGVQFDLSLIMAEGSDGLGGGIQYNADLLSREFVERLAGQFRLLLARVSRDPDCLMMDIPIFSEADRLRILKDWNRTETDYDHTIAVSELVRRRALEAPQSLAIRAQDGDAAEGREDAS